MVDREPGQRRTREVEAACVLAIVPVVERAILRRAVERAQVLDRQARFDIAMDHLQRLRVARQIKAGGEDRMVIDQIARRGRERVAIEWAVEPVQKRRAIDGRSWMLLAVIDEAGLQRASGYASSTSRGSRARSDSAMKDPASGADAMIAARGA